MLVVIGCWTLAMIAGLCLTRAWTAALSVATVVAFVRAQAGALTHLGGWMQLVVAGGAPWLVALAQARDEAALRALEADEAARMAGLSLSAATLLSLQNGAQAMEEQLVRIGEIYRVTKDTSRGLHVDELFAASLNSASRLLEARGLRLLDASQQPPTVRRAIRAEDRLVVAAAREGLAPELAMEHAVLQRVQMVPGSATGTAESLGVALPEGSTSMGWAPLVREQQVAGVLMADDLPPSQLTTLSMIANQLSLQLARVHLYQQVEALAVTDTLTGLSVRRYVMQRAQEELERSKRHGLPCTLLMADLDFFKQKNDTYGHLVGDVVLREVARLLQRNLREVDLIGRYGGEEILLMLIETAVEQAMPIAQRLKQLVELHPIRAYDELLTQTISIGAAGFPEDAQTLETLIERADEALYAAKRRGRNRVIRWSESLTQEGKTSV